MKYFAIFFLLLMNLSASIAQLPNTNIYLLNMEAGQAGLFRFSNPRFLTAFNLYGYNNQPSFINNNELYISVQTPYDTTQTDIFSLNLSTSTRTRITSTPEAEYSPQLSPDQRFFTCVRSDASLNKVQRLWYYPLDRSGGGQPALKYITDIGYYYWINADKLAIYKLNGPSNYLSLINTRDESSVQLTNNIGRTFGLLPDGKLAFIQKATDQTWYIKALDLTTYASETIIQTPLYKEDFVVTSDGTFIMGVGSKLYAYRLGDLKEWKEIADFTSYGINNIKRIAITRELDKIALVDDLNK